MYHPMFPLGGDIIRYPGESDSSYNVRAAADLAQTSAASRNSNLLFERGGVGPDLNAEVQVQNANRQAQTRLLDAQSSVLVSQVPVYRAQADLIGTQANLNTASIPILQGQAVQQAADTYKDVQGGGIAAQSFNALPYLIGGSVALGMIGLILYATGARFKPSRR